MAHFYELPVYKRAIGLAKALTKSTKKTDKDIRFTRVTAMKNQAMDIAKKIAFANDELEDLEAREAYINECLNTLHGIEIDSRVLKDADYLTKSGFGAITAAEGKLGRQLNGWSNSTLKKLGKQTDNK